MTADQHRLTRVAVIGAGLAGLTAAQELRKAGLRVTVFEKSRGLGGRLATRRPFGKDHPLGIDHGAPFANAEDAEALATLTALGQPFAPMGGPSLGVVGVPGMSGLVRPLAEGLRLHRGVEIAAIARNADRAEDDWLLHDKDGAAHGPFDAVVSAVPAPQARALLGDTCPDCAEATMAPCWTLLLALTEPLGLPMDLLRPGDGPLELVVRNSAKAERDAGEEPETGRPILETWVAHATPEWSRAHLEDDKAAVCQALCGALLDQCPATEALSNTLPEAAYAAAHRWRYARTERPAGRAFWLAEDAALGVCGDWRLGPNAGDALRSGQLLGQAMARALVSG